MRDAAPALRPVVSIAAQVLQTRDVGAGESVGYGATWRAPTPARIAILNIGYGDGLLRPIASASAAWAGDVPLPIAGRVSMDLLAIDVTAAGGGVGEGDWLALGFDLPRLARASGLSEYELLTGLGQRFERRWR